MLMLEDKYGKLINIFNKFVTDKKFFGLYECYEDCCPEVEEISDFLYWHNETTTIESGVSKAVLISQDLDYVLKIPFFGQMDTVYNEENGTYEDSWEPFINGSGEFGNNYCETELFFYEEAVNYGVEKMFAAIEAFDVLKCGIPVYKQIKVRPMNHTDSASRPKTSAHSKKMAEKYDTLPFDKEWVAAAIEIYGEEFFKHFLTFIDEVYPGIGRDMHYGNYGYTFDGKPVLLDYSGWEQ